jgi:hypothetical protein
MSHFSYIQTQFQNLFYLEKALNKLNISYTQQQVNLSSSGLSKINLVIAQSNGYDISFCWNGKEYDLVADLSFWKQTLPHETFLNNVSQEYASEVVIGEGQKIGFEPTQYKTNVDGSKTIVLERYITQ